MSHASSHTSGALKVGRSRRVPLPRKEYDGAVSERSVPGASMRRVRRIGLLLLALKFAGFCAWSSLLYHRFSLTPDFAQYQQAWYLIAHGHLNPYDTVGNFAFWQNHGEFIMWPLAATYWISPGGVGCCGCRTRGWSARK